MLPEGATAPVGHGIDSAGYPMVIQRAFRAQRVALSRSPPTPPLSSVSARIEPLRRQNPQLTASPNRPRSTCDESRDLGFPASCSIPQWRDPRRCVTVDGAVSVDLP